MRPSLYAGFNDIHNNNISQANQNNINNIGRKRINKKKLNVFISKINFVRLNYFKIKPKCNT